VFILIGCFLTGCTIGSGIDTYLNPPKLSEQHEQIYNALIKAEGSKINLKYPKSGAYLSAFVVADIDDEPTDEAIVFYEKTSITGNDVSTLRINFLDQKNGKWESVHDFSTGGTEIERVFISKLGTSQRKNVILGIGNQAEKSAQLFFYDSKTNMTENPQQLGNYSIMDIRDINNDNQNELLMINSIPTGNIAQLKWLDTDNILVSGPQLALSENSNEIVQLIYGKLNHDITAVYIDSYINTNTIITEILYPETHDGTIYLKSLPIVNGETGPINKTIRQSSLTSKDIDGDGTIEIPINSVFKGYEEKLETEQIPMTNWYIYENNMLIRKYSSYYSITDGYAFILPMRWLDQVTVKIINEEVVFYKYDEIPDRQTELLKICVVSSSDAEKIIKADEYAQYEQIYSYGDTVYLACIPKNLTEPLIPTVSEVQFNFKLIS